MSDFREEAFKLLLDVEGGETPEHVISKLVALHQRHSVPDEPTEDMVWAGMQAHEAEESGEPYREIESAYKAMIATAKESE